MYDSLGAGSAVRGLLQATGSHGGTEHERTVRPSLADRETRSRPAAAPRAPPPGEKALSAPPPATTAQAAAAPTETAITPLPRSGTASGGYVG